MTQEFSTQFTAAARYIWGGSRIHNIHYEVSENTSDVVYKIIDSLCSWRHHGSSRLLEAQLELGDPCRDVSFFVSALDLMGFND
ncbi:hypothetical protein F2Q70_00038210 [Brassica cretica]|uniref:Uncharacterized protein n=1 Tax=Brassica cretica TaxID=69181 RepID=A0A8S9KC25_BRACR|nr:hypothetical protein F2Q70_00038210 [Brassica cretica]